MRLEDIRIVLVRPSEPGNIGAICRAMKTMGLRRLRLAAPLYSRNIQCPTATVEAAGLEKLLSRALNASDVWEEAEHFASLNDALADCAISVGTTCRRGQRRKAVSLTPRELAAFVQSRQGTAAIVFGNERTGLDRGELEQCTMASHIPVNPAFPSLNVSHAVQIYAYELYQVLASGDKGSAFGEGTDRAFTGPAAVPGQWVPMNAAEIESLVQETTGLLQAIGFYTYPGRAQQERFLQDIIARAGLTIKEARYLSAILVKSAAMRKKGTPVTEP